MAVGPQTVAGAGAGALQKAVVNAAAAGGQDRRTDLSPAVGVEQHDLDGFGVGGDDGDVQPAGLDGDAERLGLAGADGEGCGHVDRAAGEETRVR